MTLLIILLIVIALILIIKSSSKKTKEVQPVENITFDIKVESRSHEYIKEKGKVLPNSDGSMTLCSENKSRVTILESTLEVANEIINICDDSSSFYESEKRVGCILMEYGIQVKEVEEFLSKVRPIIEKRVSKLIAKDHRWESLDEEDRKYRREDHQNSSMVEFDDEVTPAMSGSLSYLIFNDPVSVPLLNEVITEYGSNNISTYCEYSGKKNPIIKITNEFYRKPLEDLVKVGLAYTGQDMSVEELLSTLTLAELNEIASTDKKFTKKDKVIKYLAEREDVNSIIEKHIVLPSLFTLTPLPEQFKDFDLEKYKTSQEYYNNLACVLISLYKGLSTMDYK